MRGSRESCGLGTSLRLHNWSLWGILLSRVDLPRVPDSSSHHTSRLHVRHLDRQPHSHLALHAHLPLHSHWVLHPHLIGHHVRVLRLIRHGLHLGLHLHLALHLNLAWHSHLSVSHACSHHPYV